MGKEIQKVNAERKRQVKYDAKTPHQNSTSMTHQF